ncbi:MAG: hypothetical protein V8T45_05380 [Oscillospiraceae bacterium]
MVKPHKEHQYTNVKVILLADTVDEDTAKYQEAQLLQKLQIFLPRLQYPEVGCRESGDGENRHQLRRP